jgi:UDP-glucose 4-epimerase
MKILVAGGAGFIGSNIADAYIAQGHNVVIVDNFYMGREKNLNPKAKFIKMDICDKSIADVFKNEKFDVVNHHAAQIDVRKSVAEPLFDTTVNILGSINLL